MKKTNKTFKRFAAITSASLLAACAMAPVFTSMTSYAAADEGSITISNTTAGHTYEAYQIFDGELSGQTLSNITWGTGVKITDAALEDLAKLDDRFVKEFTYTLADSQTEDYNTWVATQQAADPQADVSTKNYYDTVLDDAGKDLVTITPVPYVTTDEKVASKIAEALVSYGDAASFAEVIGKYLSTEETDKTTSSFADGTYTIGNNNLPDGYYLVKDEDGSLENKNDAYTAYIVKVAGTVTEIAPKSEKPSVDKQVQDETADAEAGAINGWGETADHAINETFQFKLTASIPGNANLKAYETYKLVFNDTMSAGVTFENIDSVIVKSGDNTKALTLTTDYTTNATDNTDGLSWTLTVTDLIKSLPDTITLGKDAITVEVIYNAHLNEDAILSDVNVDATYSTKNPETGVVTTNINNNNVYLQYSNNPNVSVEGSSDDLGKTTDDTVGVFTYNIDNTKYKNNVSAENLLAGAGFRLYSDVNCTTEIELFKIADGKYRLAKSNEDGVEMFSAPETAQFNIIGLDVGTYYIKETTTPEGYNTCDVVKVEIVATHEENEADNGAKLTLTQSKNLDNNFINKSGTSLPDTGGIGTTIFYLGGGAMAAIGGIYLISKRRMRKSEE